MAVDDDYYNEQEQWERVKQWVRENGPWMLAGVLLGLAALAGWRWWEQRVEQHAQAASASYEQMLQTLEKGDRKAAFVLADQLRAEYGSSAYADQADLAAARALVDVNELGAANERLTRVMNNSKDSELKLVARFRLARVQLAQGNADATLATLSAGSPGAFASRFDEVRGDALLIKGDRSGALVAWRAAQKAVTETGGIVGIDIAGLELKIADLSADGIK